MIKIDDEKGGPISQIHIRKIKNMQRLGSVLQIAQRGDKRILYCCKIGPSHHERNVKNEVS
ncbi:MAG: hypothetical protein KKF46_00450 [Nanoarchaeota archaeon]|nr:hypothetical protein [Nanoarchaeota archaeon]MBU1596813.1 hypothetical protein [Nanoarchaeota archaeon]